MAQATIASFFGKVKNDTPSKKKSVAADDDDIEIIENTESSSKPDEPTTEQSNSNQSGPLLELNFEDTVDQPSPSVSSKSKGTQSDDEGHETETDTEGHERLVGKSPITPLRSINKTGDLPNTPQSSQRSQRKRRHPPDTPKSAGDVTSTPEPDSACKSASKRAALTASAERKRQESNRLKEKQRLQRERAKADAQKQKEEKERERQKEKEERERKKAEEKAEKERQKAEEKAEKERQRLEKEAEKERQRLEKEAEKEKLRLEKERQKADELERKEKERAEKEAEKQKQIQVKEEERRKKEEERKKKDDERKAKEEEKKREEAEKMAKLERQQQMLKNFIVKGDAQKPQRQSLPSGDLGGRFQPFQLKENMAVASTHRRSVDDSVKSRLDACLAAQLKTPNTANPPDLYLKILRSKVYQPMRTKATATPAGDIEIIDDDDDDKKRGPTTKSVLKAKLYQFHENRRPAYYGTWRKTSTTVTGRRPMGSHSTLDYEVDSDDEWEEEPEDADECVSDDDKDENDEEKVDDDEDDGFFVQHGYLSEGEGDDDAEEEIDEKTRRERLDAKARAWTAEKLTKSWKKLYPIVIGPIWQGEDKEPELIEKLMAYRVWTQSENAPFTSYTMLERHAEVQAKVLLLQQQQSEAKQKEPASEKKPKTVKPRPQKTPNGEQKQKKRATLTTLSQL